MSGRSTTLRAAAEVALGRQRAPQHDSGPHMVPYLRAANVKDGVLDLTDVKEMNFAPSEQQTFSLRHGDVLITEGSGSISAVGASAVWRGEIDGVVCFQNTLLRLRPRDDRADGRFLEWWARSAFGSGVFASVASGANIYHISAERVRALPIELPPLEEQRHIADFLDAETARIDRLTQLRRHQIDKIDERYNTTISELTTPGISSEDRRDELWPWLPATVETCRLGYGARVQTGVTVHGARERTSNDSEHPYLRVANVQGERLDLSEIKTITIPSDMARRSTLRPGDVVMTEANGNPDNLGRGAVWNGEIANMVHQNHVFAIRVDQSKLIPEYLAALLAASHGRRYFRFTSAQVGIATTSSSKVLDFPVPVLSLDEQRVIVKQWEKARNGKAHTKNLLTRQLDLLAERRQSLITAAVTGQFDVSTASGRNVTDGVSA